MWLEQPSGGGGREGPGSGVGFLWAGSLGSPGGFYVGQSCAPMDVFVQIRERVVGKWWGQFWRQEAGQKASQGSKWRGDQGSMCSEVHTAHSTCVASPRPYRVRNIK